MITIIRGCVACYAFFRMWKFEFLANVLNFFALILKKKSTVLDGFFLYLAQTITSMRGCVAYNDLRPWPISSRSFGLGLENRVRSVTSTVLDVFFPYLVQMITIMRRCVACDDLWPWPKSSRSFDLDFENRVRSVTFSVLDRLFFWLGIQYDSIVWVIMRGYPQNAGVLVILVMVTYCTPHNKVGGSILVSLSPSVRLSVRPASRVSSVAPTVLVGSISYLYFLSSNFRRCVTYNVSCEMLKFEFLANFSKLSTLTLSRFELGSGVNH